MPAGDFLCCRGGDNLIDKHVVFDYFARVSVMLE